MIEALITSKTRIKILVKFFLNPGTKAYLRQLASEFNESTNSVRVELNRLSETKMLQNKKEGNTIVYQANESHPLFKEIVSIVSKYTGIEVLVEQVVTYMGDLQKAYLIGNYAKGNDTGIIELVLVGNIKVSYVENLMGRIEKEINRRINYQIISDEKSVNFFHFYEGSKVLLWNKVQ